MTITVPDDEHAPPGQAGAEGQLAMLTAAVLGDVKLDTRDRDDPRWTPAVEVANELHGVLHTLLRLRSDLAFTTSMLDAMRTALPVLRNLESLGILLEGRLADIDRHDQQLRHLANSEPAS